MHNIVEIGLEDHLSGAVNREFDSHLAQCAPCRREVEGMKQVSSLLSSLRADSGGFAGAEPPTGFSSRLLREIEERRSRSIWSVFTVDPDDGALLARHTPEAVMASHDPAAAPDDPQHMNGMLMTLATYRQ